MLHSPASPVPALSLCLAAEPRPAGALSQRSVRVFGSESLSHCDPSREDWVVAAQIEFLGYVLTKRGLP
jgi:hypothetical protein